MAALGIAIKPIVTPLAQIITGPLFIPGGVVAGGFYMLWIVLGYGLTGNKPGSATLIALVQALMVLVSPFGNHGAFSLVSYTLPGIAVDLLYLLVRPGPTSPPRAFAGGVVANFAGSLPVLTVVMRVPILDAPLVFLALLTAVLSLAGGLGGLVAFGLLKQLRRFKIGVE